MTQQFGRRTNPNWDALRVQTLNVLGGIVVDSESATGGLQNKIVLWPADGSTPMLFDPDSAGLNAAITASVAGDSIWLPSVPIALTAAITIPASVALVGISHDAILSFSGFAGAAIVLSAGSIIQDFTLNHSDGLWFDASALDAKALRIIGSAQHATTGYVTPHNAQDIWIGTAEAGLFYSADYFTEATQPTFVHVSSFPSGTAALTFSGVSDDRTIGYVLCSANNRLYRFPGPAVKSPSSLVSGDFTEILKVNDVIGAYTVTNVPENLVLYQNKCLIMFRFGPFAFQRAYGEYDPIAGTWLALATANYGALGQLSAYTRIGYRGYVGSPAGGPAATFHWLTWSPTTYTWTDNFNTNYAQTTLWGLNQSGGHHYVMRVATGPLYYVHDMEANTDVLSGLVGVGAGSALILTNALTGAAAYCVDTDGKLYQSDDGATFSQLATWLNGWVWDAARSGGGHLAWIPASIASPGAVGRIYDRAGNIIQDGSLNNDRIGNFWSLTSGTRTVINVSVGYS